MFRGQSRKFCAECGAPLSVRCPSCGTENEPAEKFCGECGSALSGSTQAGVAKAPPAQTIATPIRVADIPAPENIEGERKTVTALFADIKGSTERGRPS